jgi:hypothetical protein
MKRNLLGIIAIALVLGFILQPFISSENAEALTSQKTLNSLNQTELSEERETLMSKIFQLHSEISVILEDPSTQLTEDFFLKDEELDLLYKELAEIDKKLAARKEKLN